MQVRQNYGVTIDRGFKPTSNARLSATFAETKRFADALRKFDKQCSAHLREVKGNPTSVLSHVFMFLLRAAATDKVHTSLASGHART
jgi:hypothetical protein